MPRIFLDSSAFFAAAYSRTGHAYDLLLMGVRGEIGIVISQIVITEVRRNLAESAPDRLEVLDYIMGGISFELVKPTKRQVVAAIKYVVLKDAPIVAAARMAKVDYLVTLDKKHLLGKPELVRYVRADILTPQQAFERLSQAN